MTQSFENKLKEKDIDKEKYIQMVKYLKRNNLMPLARKITFFWETDQFFKNLVDPMTALYTLYKNNQLEMAMHNWTRYLNDHQFKL